MEDGDEAGVVGESRILASLAKPSAFIPAKLLSTQNTKVTLTSPQHAVTYPGVN